MVEVIAFVQQKNKGKCQEHQNGTEPVIQSQHNEYCQDANDKKVNVHAIVWPRCYPVEAFISKIKNGINPIPFNPIVVEVTTYFDYHYQSKSDSKKCQGCNVGWFGKSLKKGLHSLNIVEILLKTQFDVANFCPVEKP